MGKLEVKLPKDLLESIEKLAEYQKEILTSTIEAGGKVVLNAVKSNLEKVIIKSPKRSTNELRDSLGMSPVKLSRKGIYNLRIGFAEPRLHQYRAKKPRSYYLITNALIVNVLEYGKKGQEGRPFMRPAQVKSKKASIEAMKHKFDEEVKKLGVK